MPGSAAALAPELPVELQRVITTFFTLTELMIHGHKFNLPQLSIAIVNEPIFQQLACLPPQSFFDGEGNFRPGVDELLRWGDVEEENNETKDSDGALLLRVMADRQDKRVPSVREAWVRAKINLSCLYVKRDLSLMRMDGSFLMPARRTVHLTSTVAIDRAFYSGQRDLFLNWILETLFNEKEPTSFAETAPVLARRCLPYLLSLSVRTDNTQADQCVFACIQALALTFLQKLILINRSLYLLEQEGVDVSQSKNLFKLREMSFDLPVEILQKLDSCQSILEIRTRVVELAYGTIDDLKAPTFQDVSDLGGESALLESPDQCWKILMSDLGKSDMLDQSDKIQRFCYLALAGADTEYQEGFPGFSTILVMAASFGFTEMVSMLISVGCDVNSQSGPSEKTALHMISLILFHDNIDHSILNLFLQAHCDPNLQDKNGRVPLMLLAESKRPQSVTCMRSLLRAGGDVDLQDSMGKTTLIYGLFRKRKDNIAELMAQGCDVALLKRSDGKTAADMVSDPAENCTEFQDLVCSFGASAK